MAYEEVYSSEDHAVRTFQGADASKADIPAALKVAGAKYIAFDTKCIYIFSEVENAWKLWA